MQQEKLLMFRNRLTKVNRHISKHARRAGISCYRIYDHDLPEFPLCIEHYDGRIYVAEYKRRHGMTDEEHDDWMEKTLVVVEEVLGIGRENIFLRLRQRKPGRLGQYQRIGELDQEFIVDEQGLKFRVNLSDYLDTGLFLDHRITRQLVREESEGKKVLNLFAYTGSFSVYAAAGKASEVKTVDLSRTYLAWAERNMKENGFTDPEKYSFVHADVIRFLPTLAEGSYDLVIMDPPTFSNSKRMDDFLDIQQDHVSLINHCMHALSPGGVLYFSTNYRKFSLDKEKIRASSIRDITQATTAIDFEGKFSRFCYKLTR